MERQKQQRLETADKLDKYGHSKHFIIRVIEQIWHSRKVLITSCNHLNFDLNLKLVWLILHVNWQKSKLGKNFALHKKVAHLHMLCLCKVVVFKELFYFHMNWLVGKGTFTDSGCWSWGFKFKRQNMYSYKLWIKNSGITHIIDMVYINHLEVVIWNVTPWNLCSTSFLQIGR